LIAARLEFRFGVPEVITVPAFLSVAFGKGLKRWMRSPERSCLSEGIAG
jgi:hypothetical protein